MWRDPAPIKGVPQEVEHGRSGASHEDRDGGGQVGTPIDVAQQREQLGVEIGALLQRVSDGGDALFDAGAQVQQVEVEWDR